MTSMPGLVETHPAVRRAWQTGDVKKAYELLAQVAVSNWRAAQKPTRDAIPVRLTAEARLKQSRADRQQAIIVLECEYRRWRAQRGSGKYCRSLRKRIGRLKEKQRHTTHSHPIDRAREAHNY